MKIKISILASSIILMIGASSCSDWLDVRPEGEIILNDFWKTETDAQSVMAACYRGMIQNEYIERIFAWGELRSDNVVKGSSVSETIEDVLLQEIEPTHAYTKWTSFYNVINICNTFLKYAPSAQAADDNFTLESLHSMEAEVVALRSLTYFYLIRAFDKVPYITTASIDDNQNYLVGQTDQNVLIDSLISDLNSVVRYAPLRHQDNRHTKGRITRNAIYALLADIYLWKGDYQNCINMCEKVINDKSLELIDSKDFFSAVFYTGNSVETIFELQFDDIVQKNSTTSSLFGNRDNEGNLNVPSVLVSSQYSPFNFGVANSAVESDDDTRFYDYFCARSGGNTYRIFKYAGMNRKEQANGTNEYTYRSNTSNWIVYRLADVILMKAEAVLQRDKNTANEATGIQTAIDLVNTTYLRSNPTSDSLKVGNYNGFSEIESLVLRERQRELMFEGKRYFDLLRLAKRENSTSKLTTYISRTSESEELMGNMSTIQSLYWPINEDELIANPTLVQNSFYESTYSKK